MENTQVISGAGAVGGKLYRPLARHVCPGVAEDYDGTSERFEE